MKQQSRFNLKSVTVFCFSAVALLLVVFSVLMYLFKDSSIYAARNIASYKTVQNYSLKEINDSSAPVGVRKEYSWQIGNIDNNESCLIFYIVHSYADVRLDDELVYSLSAGDNMNIGESPSSNWVVVPLYLTDVGRKVTVTVTPVYKSSVGRDVEFKIGSRYAVFMQRLKTDLHQIVLSALCIIMGILLVIVQLSFVFNKRTSSFDMLYLGIFSMLMGIWRITDTRFSPIIFEKHEASLGYITLSALFLLAIPLILFVDERHKGKFRTLLRVAALATTLLALVAFILHVAGVMDLRETLNWCHIMLIIDIATLFFVCFFKSNVDRDFIIFIVLLGTGSIADFLHFYIEKTSSGMIYTLIAFLLYTIYLFSANILDINRKAYFDVNTKLYNKTRWNEYIRNNIPENEPIGIMMLDLNRLKSTNDTLGHEAGDKMILKFSEILRETFAPAEFVCRWGGDEFVAVVRNADREKMEDYVTSIHAAVDSYNASGEKPEIHFACGYALSEEFPSVSKNELLAKADEHMYTDKNKWYKEHHLTN